MPQNPSGNDKARPSAAGHIPIMVREVLKLLAPRPGEIVADCTVGFGGHALQFASRIGPTGRLIGTDVDGPQLARTRRRLASAPAQISLHHANYTQIADILGAEGIDGCDVLFADLGVSGMQIDDAASGISYKHDDAPLDMRMDARLARTAADVLATIPEDQLSRALRDLGDEPDHQRIAEWIVVQRYALPISRTGQLIRLIFDAKGLSKKNWRDQPSTRYGALHPAARTFQALRILVNDELAHLRRLLEIAPTCLRPGGRIGIISFHSGEDRLVKRAFRQGREADVYQRISPKPIVPQAPEVRANRRSASAKFRWALRA